MSLVWSRSCICRYLLATFSDLLFTFGNGDVLFTLNIVSGFVLDNGSRAYEAYARPFRKYLHYEILKLIT